MATLAYCLDVSFAAVDKIAVVVGAVAAAECECVENGKGLAVFTGFSVGPMTAAFSFQMKIQEIAQGVVDSADNFSLLMAPSRVPTFSWADRQRSQDVSAESGRIS